MIIVIGWLHVDPEQRAAFVADSAEAVRAARTTAGCLDFAVSADTVDADRVNISERWENEDALAAFRGSGPDDDQQSVIRSYAIEEYQVQAQPT